MTDEKPKVPIYGITHSRNASPATALIKSDDGTKTALNIDKLRAVCAEYAQILFGVPVGLVVAPDVMDAMKALARANAPHSGIGQETAYTFVGLPVRENSELLHGEWFAYDWQGKITSFNGGKARLEAIAAALLAPRHGRGNSHDR